MTWPNRDDDAPDVEAQQRELADVRRRIRVASDTLAQASTHLGGLEAQTGTERSISPAAFLAGMVIAVPFWIVAVWFLAWASK